jgi:quaternary ammonium compound-resistance protein SugE
MNWVILIAASLFEVGFATCLGKLKYASGNAFLMWFAGFAVCLILSIYLLYRATATLPIGTAYAIWTGLGAVGITLVGIYLFKEPTTFWRMFFMAMLIASIVGLKLVTPQVN